MAFLSRVMVLKSRAHFSAGAKRPAFGGANFEGSRKRKSAQARNRVGINHCLLPGLLLRHRRASCVLRHEGAGSDIKHYAGRPADGIATGHSGSQRRSAGN